MLRKYVTDCKQSYRLSCSELTVAYSDKDADVAYANSNAPTTLYICMHLA